MKNIQRTFAVFSGVIAITLLVGCGKEEKPAPPPPPPPVAAVPEKCADTDMDGVCDTADQCPDTKMGTRVGPVGCDCDYTIHTHFANDSADLVAAEDKDELDRLAAVMMNPKLQFVAGEIDGYTDNVGEAAYNENLSKQRADAVANYLKSKGVVLGDRFTTKGFGAADPVGDNTTEEGRAANRRVVIHRTDCGPAPAM